MRRGRTAKTIAAVPLVAFMMASSTVVHTTAQAADEAPTVLFVVDTSGSMSGSRIAEAKEALNLTIDALDDDQPAGLRSYAGSCGNGGILRTPIGTDNRDELRSAVNALPASGGTPTPDALRAAENDLSGVTGPRSIVLISDGQSGCGDPCPVAADIAERLGIGFTVHTVGFQATDAAENELACIADATGGQYFSVDDAEGLAEAIGDVLNPNTDRDGDGLLNLWETEGVDVDGDGTIDVDLPALGADPDVPDIFIEVDWMEDTGFCFFSWCASRTSYRPTNSQMAIVYDAFRAAPYPVRVHIDSGSESRTADGERWGDASGGNPFDHTETLLTDDLLYDGYREDRADNLTEVRDELFYHAVIADNLNNGSNDIGGRAFGIPGNAFVVSQGLPSSASNTVIGGTFLHELGHTLGLRHGGDVNTHYKPNYVSSMNYLFQNRGIPSGPSAAFSATEFPPLDETALDEDSSLPYATSFLCHNAVNSRALTQVAANDPVDWNCDGTIDDDPVVTDITYDGVEEVLDGFDDWANLQVGEGINDYAELGFVPNNSPEELPLDQIPTNTDDRVEISGLRDLTIDVGADLPVVTYTVRNTGDDADTFTVDVSGSAADADSVEVGPVTAGASVPVAVPVTGPGLVEVLVTSGNDPSVAASTDTIVTIVDVFDLDPADVLLAVAAHLDEASAETGLNPGEQRQMKHAAADLRSAVDELAGSRPTWDAKAATLAINRAANGMRSDTRNDEVNVGLDVLLGVLADAAGRVASEAVDFAEVAGGDEDSLSRARAELDKGHTHAADQAWGRAIDAFKRAAADAHDAHNS